MAKDKDKKKKKKDKDSSKHYTLNIHNSTIDVKTMLSSMEKKSE